MLNNAKKYRGEREINSKLLGSLSILVLLVGICSLALGHAAEAATKGSDQKSSYKV
jgi:hypothetical protein